MSGVFVNTPTHVHRLVGVKDILRMPQDHIDAEIIMTEETRNEVELMRGINDKVMTDIDVPVIDRQHKEVKMNTSTYFVGIYNYKIVNS
jgi:hypothetical protein